MPTQRKSTGIRKAAKSGWDPTRKQRRLDTRRKKISTTVAAESYAFLERLMDQGKADSLAEAMDLVLREARRLDNRTRLEHMTAEAYEKMSPEAIAEEKEVVEALSQSIGEINFDE
jgi:hypothetical protein